MNNFATKMNEARRKIIAKNKASKGLHIWNKKEKKQTREQVNNCAQGRPKNYANCKIETSKKKCNTNFVITQPKKQQQHRKKSRAHVINAYNTKTTTRQSANNKKEAKPAKHTTTTSLARRSQHSEIDWKFPLFFFLKKREPIKIDQNAAVTGSLGNPVPIPM